MKSWLIGLQKVLANQSDVVPAGWLTAVEVGKEWGRSRARTSELLKLMVDTGKAERKAFKVVRNGARRVVPYYRLRK